VYRCGRTGERGTVPLEVTDTLVASASHPIISAISFTRAFVSREVVDEERSWESFACRQGCLETWTLGGRGVDDMVVVVLVRVRVRVRLMVVVG
jgi:hypothetical protein